MEMKKAKLSPIGRIRMPPNDCKKWLMRCFEIIYLHYDDYLYSHFKVHPYWLSLLVRFSTTFTVTSFSSVRLSAIIKVRATSVLSAMRL